MTNYSDRIAILARQAEPVFHSRDLARLWNIQNSNTLYTLLKRYTKKGTLKRVYKGFYSLLPIHQLDPIFLGLKALHSFAYVSTETILIQEGLMMQMIHEYTLVSSQSCHFIIGPHHFRSRQLKDQYLFNPAGIFEANGILKATPLRALADFLYFNSKAYLDGMGSINIEQLNELQKEIGYPLTTPFNALAA